MLINKRRGVVPAKVYFRDGKPNWWAMIGILARTALNCFIIFCWVNGFKYGALACIDRGVMSAMTSSNVAFQWIVGYFIFKEAVLVKNVIGTFIIIMSVLVSQLPQLFGFEFLT